MRILFCTQMWPGPDDPDLGAFLVPVVRELESARPRGRRRRDRPPAPVADQVRAPDRATRSRGAADPARRDLRPRPVSGRRRRARSPRSPRGRRWSSWPTARTSPTWARSRGVTGATRRVVGRARGRDRELALARRPPGRADPGGGGRSSRSPTAASTSTPSPPGRPPRRARELGWDGDGPAFLCVGSLIERKNVSRSPMPSSASAAAGWRSSATGRCARRLEGRAGVASPAASPRPRCRAGSPPATCSASRR